MLTHFSSNEIPLPRDWTANVRTAVLHVISLAHLAITCTRSFAANSLNARIRLASELERAKAEISRLEEELRIKDARMARIVPHRRPHYPPTERLAILELKAARGWSQAESTKEALPRSSRCLSQ